MGRFRVDEHRTDSHATTTSSTMSHDPTTHDEVYRSETDADPFTAALQFPFRQALAVQRGAAEMIVEGLATLEGVQRAGADATARTIRQYREAVDQATPAGGTHSGRGPGQRAPPGQFDQSGPRMAQPRSEAGGGPATPPVQRMEPTQGGGVPGGGPPARQPSVGTEHQQPAPPAGGVPEQSGMREPPGHSGPPDPDRAGDQRQPSPPTRR